MPAPRLATRPLILRWVAEPSRDADRRLTHVYDLLLAVGAAAREGPTPPRTPTAAASPSDCSCSYSEVLS
jgi:hypothetical protein